jgi:hypothetical protein
LSVRSCRLMARFSGSAGVPDSGTALFLYGHLSDSGAL